MNCTWIYLCSALVWVPAASAAEPRPTTSTAPVPSAGYDSAFKDYESYREQPLAEWRSLNDEVARAGGHVGIMRGTGGASAPPDSKGMRPREGQRATREAPAGGPHKH